MTGNQIIVMIVDDDDSIRSAVRRLMKSYGLAVETFASAEEFLGSDRLAKTSCLILDVHMPGMNGLELQNRLVASGSVVPIIFITAFTDDRARAQAMNAGAAGYLAKPFSDDELLNCIHSVLEMLLLMFRRLRCGESGPFGERSVGNRAVHAGGATRRLHAPPGLKRGELCNQEVHRFALSTLWTTIRHCLAHSNVLSARRD